MLKKGQNGAKENKIKELPRRMLLLMYFFFFLNVICESEMKR